MDSFKKELLQNYNSKYYRKKESLEELSDKDLKSFFHRECIDSFDEIKKRLELKLSKGKINKDFVLKILNYYNKVVILHNEIDVFREVSKGVFEEVKYSRIKSLPNLQDLTKKGCKEYLKNNDLNSYYIK